MEKESWLDVYLNLITNWQCEIFRIFTSKHSVKYNRLATWILKFDLKQK